MYFVAFFFICSLVVMNVISAVFLDFYNIEQDRHLALVQEPLHLSEREALDACLHKLPAAQRELVLTAYTKGTRMDDLATQRGQTPMALYKLLHRIRQALLDCVQRTLAQEEHP
jgi:DNA-directed RNA polymerase specialized sigma24 family protein